MFLKSAQEGTHIASRTGSHTLPPFLLSYRNFLSMPTPMQVMRFTTRSWDQGLHSLRQKRRGAMGTASRSVLPIAMLL